MTSDQHLFVHHAVAKLHMLCILVAVWKSKEWWGGCAQDVNAVRPIVPGLFNVLFGVRSLKCNSYK
jgi:hypothetical protein